MKLVLCCLVVLLALAAATAQAATRDCGTLSVRSGSVYQGARNGPTCFLAAFERCRAATFTLSVFGLDTVATDVFRVVARGACRVEVAGTFHVVPQKPHSLSAVCRAVRRSGADVVAVGCTGSLQGPISLTGRSS